MFDHTAWTRTPFARGAGVPEISSLGREDQGGQQDVPVPVIMYVEPDDTAARQRRHILDYCETHGFDVLSICISPASAAEAVAAGIAQIVVGARDPRNGLRHLVAVAGGRVVLVRDPNRLPSLRDFLARALHSGRTPHDIARAVGSETADIAELLKRLKLDHPNRRDE